jgi:ABC-2 type transport system ATP-binding protein
MPVLLRAEGIRVEFGTLVAVSDASFELQGEQLLGLVGPNGAGKTTLMRVLAGLHSPTRGAAYVMDRPVLGVDEIVRDQVGFAPDSPPAYEELTIQQFLEFIGGMYRLSRRETSERIDYWLEQLWLTDKRDTLVRNLSRGMRQRVTLARTFLPNPHVILLDEPLSGLDPAGRIQLRRVFSMLREQGCAMIVSSHILADLEEVSTHVAIIEHGRILRWNTTESLVHHDAARRTYRLTLADGAEDYSGKIAPLGGVSGLRREDRDYFFEYDGEDRAAADLLRKLVELEVPVCSFSTVRMTLEDVYLRSGVKQVD